MKKIAILAPYVGEVNRGAETFVIELVKKLKSNYEIDVYSTQKCSQLGSIIKVVDIKKGIFLSINEKLYKKSSLYKKICERSYFLIPDVCFQRKFSKEVFKRNIENKNYHLLFPNNGIWGAKFSKRFRDKTQTPFIYTGHGGIGTGERLILKTKPNMYISLTEKHLKWARGYSEKVEKIPNGISLDNFKNINQNKEKRLILSVGALTEFKRHELTIDAVANMDDDIKLLIVGDGELKDNITAKGKELLGNRFELKKVPYEVMNEVYQNATLFVLPSLDEPFGIVYLEAMANNLPIVAPDDEPRREIIEDAGLFCDCKNKVEYAKAMEQALKIDWGHKPKERAKAFEWQSIVEKYESMIERVISENEV